MYSLSDFDFDLPTDRIAQFPLKKRSASKLLCIQNGQFIDTTFTHLVDFLHPNDLLVFNNTKVLKARFWGSKKTGGKIEILVERVLDPHQVLAKIRASKSPKENSIISINDTYDVKVLGRDGEFFILSFPDNAFDIIEQFGHLPLPPYITRAANDTDDSRYQTVFAQQLGAVAAPTAGLHFDETVFAQLAQKQIRHSFLTLHVGAGTFQPVRTEDLSKHHMHSEWYFISQETIDAINKTKLQGGRVIAVGTTSLRALESCAQSGKLSVGSHETDIFITPGYQFRIVDALITNFHLPKSTLLMLVSAFAGYDTIKQAYAHAIANNYRFFSYGDAMFLSETKNKHV